MPVSCSTQWQRCSKVLSKQSRLSVSLQGRRAKTRHQPVRRSGRLNGSAAEFGGIDGDDCATVTYLDYEPGLKDLLAGGRHALSDVSVSICACRVLPALTLGPFLCALNEIEQT
jgi:hypothetical protein